MTISYINNNFFMEGSNGNLDDFICLRDISISLCLTPTIVKTWHISIFSLYSQVKLIYLVVSIPLNKLSVVP